MRRIAMAAATMLALAVAGCGNKADSGGGGDAAANWPQRDLRIMAPADPGGGWDTTARVMGQTLTQSKAVDTGIEVYNVPGAGGTIGLSQLTSKQAGKSNELMLMGLVMLGAILSALFLARTFVRPDVVLAERSAEEDEATHWGTPGLIMAALLAYAFLLEPVGYPLATAIVFIAIARLLGSRATVRDVIVGLVLGFGLFTAFTQYLGVSLPAGVTPLF